MFDMKKVARDFSASATRYNDHARIQEQVLEQLWKKAVPHITPSAKILDAGCGTGRLAVKYPAHSITQLDIAYSMCQVASKHGKPAINATITQLPFADATFDVVFSSLALQWIPDFAAAQAELKRVVKQGGIVAISCFGTQTLHELKASFVAFDATSPISPFPTKPEGWHSETLTEYYPDMLAIMRHLKAIGANNKLEGRSRKLMTPGKMAKISDYYHKHFSKEGTLPVMWDVMYGVEKL